MFQPREIRMGVLFLRRRRSNDDSAFAGADHRVGLAQRDAPRVARDVGHFDKRLRRRCRRHVVLPADRRASIATQHHYRLIRMIGWHPAERDWGLGG